MVKMKIAFLLLFLILFFSGIALSIPGVFQKQQRSAQSNSTHDSITYTTFKSNQGWGYDIFVNSNLYIHQPNIPAKKGNQGFSKKEFAGKTARLIIEKMKKHLLPPTVTLEELDSLNVLK